MAPTVRSAPPAGVRSAPTRPADRGRAPLLAAAGVAAAVGVIALADPRSNHLPLCPLHAATGLDCPLCGGLRAVQDLSGADVAGAADHNLLLVASLPFLVVTWVIWFRRTRADDPRPATAPSWLLPTGLAIALLFALLRNLPALAWLDSR